MRWALLYLTLNPKVEEEFIIIIIIIIIFRTIIIIIIIIFFFFSTIIIMMTMMVKVQQRCQSEVDKLGSRIPGIDQMASLPYCQVIFMFFSPSTYNIAPSKNISAGNNQ